MTNSYIIRPFEEHDLAATAGVWHRAGLAAYSYLPDFQALTLEKAQWVFENVILPPNNIWVGTQDGRIEAYLAMKASFIDRLYVDPRAWRQGWGTRLVQFAKAQSPLGLELFTHQANTAARALYEKHGFIAVKFGLSPPPESAPDVEYHWRPRTLEGGATGV